MGRYDDKVAAQHGAESHVPGSSRQVHDDHIGGTVRSLELLAERIGLNTADKAYGKLRMHGAKYVAKPGRMLVQVPIKDRRRDPAECHLGGNVNSQGRLADSTLGAVDAQYGHEQTPWH